MWGLGLQARCQGSLGLLEAEAAGGRPLGHSVVAFLIQHLHEPNRHLTFSAGLACWSVHAVPEKWGLGCFKGL